MRFLANLLTAIYPVIPIEPRSPGRFRCHHHGRQTKKYEMARSVSPSGSRLCKLRRYPKSSNRRFLYRIHARTGRGNLARAAAKASLQHPLTPDVVRDKLDPANVPVFRCLLRYRGACSASAVSTVQGKNLSWATKEQSWWEWSKRFDCACKRKLFSVQPRERRLVV